MNKVHILFTQEELIHKDIRFADQKATIFLSLNTAILIGLSKLDFTGNAILERFNMLGSVFLGISILILFCVVWPRGNWHKELGKGIINPIRIAQYDNCEDYVFDLIDETESEKNIKTQIGELIYQRAKINTKKYFLVNTGFVFGSVGWLTSIIIFLNI